MNQKRYILPKLADREQWLAQINACLAGLGRKCAWRVTIEEHRPLRSNQQNRYLWGVVYPEILKQGKLEGWQSDDLHEYLLGECYGWAKSEGFGRTRLRPVKRSAKLNKMEFVDYIAFIQQRMAEHGIVVPDPDQEFAT